MTLSEFINKKPPELRLGQWFVNCFMWRLHPSSRLHETMNKLYYTSNPMVAVGIIHKLMEDYQWTELPDWSTTE